MPMQSSWVDELFARLSLRYGVAFTRQYADLDPVLVKADWAQVLDGVSAEGVKFALGALPADKAPNAMQFRALCGSAPRDAERVRLAAPVGKPSPEVLAKVAAINANRADPKQWARDLQKRERQSPKGLTQAQRQMWRDALGVDYGVAA